MSDFALFDKALQEYEKVKHNDLPETIKNKKVSNVEMTSKTRLKQVKRRLKAKKKLEKEKHLKANNDECSHENTIVDKGCTICTDCGEEISQKISQCKEWRYYGQVDTKHMSDPNRVHMRKTEERGIFKDVENFQFSENIVAQANQLYAQVTRGKIYRGDSRKSIIFACIFHAYKINNKAQSHKQLLGVFGLDRKLGLHGLKLVNLNAPRGSNIRTTYITPIHLVEEIMNNFSATIEQKKEVIELYNQIKNKSSRLNRARPQSVGAALVYYWICLTNKDISLKKFTEKVNLSELTVSKLAREIEKVRDTPGVV